MGQRWRPGLFNCYNTLWPVFPRIIADYGWFGRNGTRFSNIGDRSKSLFPGLICAIQIGKLSKKSVTLFAGYSQCWVQTWYFFSEKRAGLGMKWEIFPEKRRDFPKKRDDFPKKRDGFPVGRKSFSEKRGGFPIGKKFFPKKRDGLSVGRESFLEKWDGLWVGKESFLEKWDGLWVGRENLSARLGDFKTISQLKTV